ncbi:MAG: hypothetical protein ACE5J7_01295 [Candidatus Aenigmatarchaeota archaeon]
MANRDKYKVSRRDRLKRERKSAEKRLAKDEKELARLKGKKKALKRKMKGLTDRKRKLVCQSAEEVFRVMLTSDEVEGSFHKDIMTLLDMQLTIPRKDFYNLVYDMIGVHIYRSLVPLCTKEEETEVWGGYDECVERAYDSCLCRLPALKIALQGLIEDKDEIEEHYLKWKGDKKGLKKRQTMKNKINNYMEEIRERFNEIREVKKKIRGYGSEIKKIKSRPSYREEFEKDYELADKLFDYIRRNYWNNELGFRYGNSCVEDDLRELRNRMLVFCDKLGITPGEFFDEFYSGPMGSRAIMNVLGRLSEYGSGYTSHRRIVKLGEDVEKEKGKMTDIQYQIDDMNFKVDNMYRKLNLISGPQLKLVADKRK